MLLYYVLMISANNVIIIIIIIIIIINHDVLCFALKLKAVPKLGVYYFVPSRRRTFVHHHSYIIILHNITLNLIGQLIYTHT
jgi:hypothetical protein